MGILEAVFWMFIGALVGWWFLPQPQWAQNLRDKIFSK